MASKILRKKLPPNMRSDFWNDFIDCIEDESELAKLTIVDKRTFNNVETMSYSRMLEISELLDMPFNVSLSSDPEFLRKEIEAIPFKIKWKATTLLYLSFFKALDDVGMIYLYYYDSSNLIRNTENLLNYTNGIDPSEPYYQRSVMNFSSVISDDTKLDDGLYLDTGWNLDSRTSKLNTKHLSLEFFLNKVVEVDSKEYLITPNCFSFIQINMNKYKKATEVIHIGCQLGALTDSSGYYNSSGLSYTMPSLKLNCVTTSNFSSVVTVDDIYYMIFGIGTKTNLPSSSGGVEPTELTSKVAKIKILDVEKYETSTWLGVNAQYIGNMINDEQLGTGDDVTSTFSSNLAYFPVKKENVLITFTSAGNEYTLADDGFGNLYGTNGEGTINYTTGAVYINTNIYYPVTESIGSGDGTTLIFNYTTVFPIIKESSIIIKYIISGTTYAARDDGSGNIVGTSVSGTINYTTGILNLVFTLVPANGTTINMTYSYQKTSIPDNNTPIVTAYYFLNDSIEITEAGITNLAGNLIAYATFPPVKFKDYYNHLNMFFMINKSIF